MFDKNLHDKGKELYLLFQEAIDCSRKVMYPEYLSLSGESGIASEVYKKYGKVISPERYLDRNDTIAPLMKSATASFGFIALNKLQRLYNGKALVEDGTFALEVLMYTNKKVGEFQKKDAIQYSVYGTPVESLCERQVNQFREKFGVIGNVSGREYFSNSFHCHVSEDISPIQKQEYEARFWNYANGGKIQYIRIAVPHNAKALEAIVLHAMDLGLYEGINMSLAYCNTCGFE